MTSEDSVDTLLDALVRYTFQVTGVLTRIGAANDLSLTQLRVFGILRDRRPRVTELAAYLGLDKSTMSGLIDRAERRGLLAREKNPTDRRAVDVFLTPAGHELTRRLYGEARDFLAPDLDRLRPDQREQLTALLRPLLEPDS
ncbi:MarR family winged helix-turn-helix transcriptional regulator [Actinoplanes flavus]|uniref:MarR family transcriptional regulator n=1 Tax=Actinoplanes flavus TaxID=2820290 RepID=A0ABS3UIQ2_9ACTN|nr:MarR family transcriptional regulator [Actinoplanes flavus]MBO3737613.1 MarR family transcriptional regulator [Actinoplanes flavus]